MMFKVLSKNQRLGLKIITKYFFLCDYEKFQETQNMNLNQTNKLDSVISNYLSLQRLLN
jgi:hypothetical protein